MKHAILLLPLLAAPFFLAVLISIASVRSSVFRSFSRVEARIAFLFSVVLPSAMLAWVVVQVLPDGLSSLVSLKPREWMGAIGWALPLAIAVVLIRWLQRRGAPREARAAPGVRP